MSDRLMVNGGEKFNVFYFLFFIYIYIYSSLWIIEGGIICYRLWIPGLKVSVSSSIIRCVLQVAMS
jgi:hypothetical protein